MKPIVSIMYQLRPSSITRMLCFANSSLNIYSWTSPMMTVRHGRDAKHRVNDELHIGRVHEYFYHAAQQCTKSFWHFLSRAHSTSPFRTVKCRSHWTAHNDFQGSIARFDYGQFHMNTCSYGSWSFRCMIKDIQGLFADAPLMSYSSKLNENECDNFWDQK